MGGGDAGLGEEEGRGFKAVVRTARPELEMEFCGVRDPKEDEGIAKTL